MPTWTFIKAAGAPAGTINVRVATGDFIIDDSTHLSIVTTDSATAYDLSGVIYLQLQGGSPTPVPVSPVIETVELVDGVLSKPSPTGAHTPLNSAAFPDGVLTALSGLSVAITQAPYNVAPTDANPETQIISAINAVSAAGGGEVRVPKGTYVPKTGIPMANNVTLAFEEGAKFDFTQAAPVSGLTYKGIYANGSVGSPTYTSMDVRAGEMEVELAGDQRANFAAGSWVLLANDPPKGSLVTDPGTSGTTITVDNAAGAADFSSPLGQLYIEKEYIAYTNAVVSRGGGAGGTDRWTFTVRSAPSAAFGRGNRGSTASAHTVGTTVHELHTGKARYYLIGTGQSYALGEMAQIDRVAFKQIDGTTSNTSLIFTNPVFDNYRMADKASVRAITPVVNAKVRNAHVIFPSTVATDGRSEYGIKADWTIGFEVTGSTVENCQTQHIGVSMSAHVKVHDNTIDGKASSDTAPHGTNYGVAMYNNVQFFSVEGNDCTNVFKTFTASNNSLGQNFWGEPTSGTVTGNTQDNAAVGYTSRHPAYELHAGGRYITVSSNSAHGCSYLLALQSARHITAIGNTGDGWILGGLQFDNTLIWNDVHIIDNDFGKRSRGPGRTTVISDDGANNLVVANATFLIDQTSTGSPMLVRIDDELIAFSGYSPSGGNYLLTGLTRGSNNTASATHSAGADVRPWGYYRAGPIYMEFQDCCWPQRAYDQPVSQLTTGVTSIDVSMVLDNTIWPSAVQSGLALVEGEDSSHNFIPEVVSYSAATNGGGHTTLTITGRGLLGTRAVSHSAGVFVMPYEAAVRNIEIRGNTGECDLDWHAIDITGYAIGEQFEVKENKLTFNGKIPSTSGRGYALSYGIFNDVANADIDDNKLYNYPNGILTNGGRSSVVDNKIRNATQDAVATGFGVRIAGLGDLSLAEKNKIHFARRGVVIDAGVSGANVVDNFIEIDDQTRAVVDAGTGSFVEGNRVRLPSGLIVMLQHAADLWLPGLDRPQDHGLVTWSAPPKMTGSTFVLPVTGIMQVVRLKWPGGTINGIRTWVDTAGVTLTNSFVAVYQNGALLRQSGDMSASWMATGTKDTVGFTAVNAVVGDILVALWSNGTTGVTLRRTAGSGSMPNIGQGATTYDFATDSTSGARTTTAPSTLGTLASLNSGCLFVGAF